MARRRAVLALAAAGIAVCGGLAWLLLAPTSPPRSARGPADASPDARSGGAVAGAPPAGEEGSPSGGAPGSRGSPIEPPAHDPARGADGDRAALAALRPVTAATDTGLPLPGVRLDWEGGEMADDDPSMGNLVDRNGNPLTAASRQRLRDEGYFRKSGEAATDGEGRAEIPAAATSVTVSHPFATFVRAEDAGEVHVAADRARVALPPGGTAVRLVFHDRDGLAQVLLRNAVSGAAIRDVSGVRIEWMAADGRRWRFDFRRDNGLGGWIAMDEQFLGETLTEPLDPATTQVEFSAPEFARRRVPMTDLRGRVELRLEPEIPSARGTVVLGPGLANARVTAELRGIESVPAARAASEARGLPTAPGPFALHDLAEGSYVLEVSASMGGYMARATRRFDVHAPADLGEIVVRAGAGIRARILDADGRPLPQADVVVVRPEEDPAQARRLDPDPSGWVAFGDLEPGIDHRVVVLGLPTPMERVVRTPAAPGASVDAEFRWTGSVVECRFRFTLEGRPLRRPTALRETPVRDSRVRWEDEGTLVTALLPGRHRFAIDVVYEDGTAAGLYAAVVDVPSGDGFSATLALEPDGGGAR